MTLRKISKIEQEFVEESFIEFQGNRFDRIGETYYNDNTLGAYNYVFCIRW